jgi:hypothetical protein
VPEVVIELRVMLTGFSEQVRPVGTVSVRLTVPVKPLIAMTVIVELASLLVSTAALVGLAEMVKSTTVTETAVEADSAEEVPVTVITALPVSAPAVIVRVAFCFPPTDRLTLLGVILVTKPQAQPVEVALRFTGPLKLPTLVTVIVELTDAFAETVTVCGLADRMKPCTCTVTFVDLVVLPLDPVTVTT